MPQVDIMTIDSLTNNDRLLLTISYTRMHANQLDKFWAKACDYVIVFISSNVTRHVTNDVLKNTIKNIQYFSL